MKLQNIDLMRKKPVQKRSEATIDTIFEATTQILDSDGEKGLNTNEIAARSGFSIGTLYQYFRNKDVILQALAEREFKKARVQLEELAQRADTLSADEAVRAVVRIVLGAFSGRPKARRAVMLFVMRRGDPRTVWRIEIEMGNFIFERMRWHPAFNGAPDGLRRRMLVSTVMGAIRGALIDEPDLLTKPEFEDELVRFVLAYLGVSA